MNNNINEILNEALNKLQTATLEQIEKGVKSLAEVIKSEIR